MFVYLIIAIELVILYIAFWIVFLRDPKPEINAELWGSYFKPGNRSSNSAVPSVQLESPIETKELPFYLPPTPPVSYVGSKLKKTRRKRNRNRRSLRSHSYCQLCSRPGHNQLMHKSASFTQEASRTVVEKFLFSLNRVLNGLSVKLP